MENVNEGRNPEVFDNKAKLEAIHQDIKRLMERSNQEYLNLMLANLKKDFMNAITAYVEDDIESGLERNMLDPCEMRDTCKSRFKEFLENNTDLIKCDNISKDMIDEKRDDLSKLKKLAPFDKCNVCFNEVNSLFDKQLHLINSLQIYNSTEKRPEISTIPEEFMVKKVLEPLSNKQRLQILKSMASETRTFSTLSELTGLRGGNLLFHIQKLLESDLILQRHERGDYMITKKGYNLLIMLADIQKYMEKE